jgi:dTDP-4-amino-4,6-dideoxygalactose transaminase
MIPIVKPYLPERKRLDAYIDSIYKTNWLTNKGPLVQKLTQRLADHLGLNPECLVLVANGSLALHLAYKALGLTGEVITTPFSFIATASTLKWEGLQPVFSDIDANTWNLDPNLITQHVSPKTSAIVPVHVFGNPCEVDVIQEIANKHKLKVIYDASHAFDAHLNGESVLKHGDASTISFHATKLFHTAEGGAIVTKTKATADKIREMINFGINHTGAIRESGTNAKMSEFHAAMGLAVLDEIDQIKRGREKIWQQYFEALSPRFQLQQRHQKGNNNYAYFPVVLENEAQVNSAIVALREKGIQARRYFYPSLETVEILGLSNVCSNAADISSRIICLPIWPGLFDVHVSDILSVLAESVR